ncbi:protein DMR6 OXYGENASE [Salix suchowensis]|nr:protein DMR6 OXYGENASE [Salix suchowensis]
MGEVDPAFIQAQEHRPKPDFTRAEGIPLIDLSIISSPNSNLHNDQALGGLVEEIGDACKNWGFFRIFFDQPLEEKRKVRRNEEKVLGYYDTEHTKNVRDWKEVFDLNVQDPTVVPASYKPADEELTRWFNQWPEYPADLREVCEEYAKEIEKLAYKLMGLIALSLGLPEDRFHGFFEEHTSFIRLNHYPPCPVPDLALGVWSNDTYESVEHRAMVNSGRERFSIPCFLGPAHYTNVQPLEELINQQNPAKYKPYNWGKFLVTRKGSNFQKLDVENIQIHHFKIPGSELAEKLD